MQDRVAQLAAPAAVRRLDVFPSEIASAAARAARSADTFVALRPSGIPEESQQIVENVLFGSGRHVFLVPPGVGLFLNVLPPPTAPDPEGIALS